MYKITNNPDDGDFEPIDSWPFQQPEWYYRLGVESNSKTQYQRNYHKDQNGDWISTYTWTVGKEHIFYVDDTSVEITIKLMDSDEGLWAEDDLADVSAYPGGGEDDSTTDKRAAIYHGTYDLVTNELITTDDISSDEGYFVTIGDGSNNAKVWFKISDDYEPAAIDCEGGLSWIDVDPDSVVTGSFSIENDGHSDSKLDWEIVEYPSWGIWSFTPSEGEDLRPSDGKITIDVDVRAPDIKNDNYNGQIKIVNLDDENDFDIVPVTLATPRGYNSIFIQILERFFEMYPQLFPVLRSLFGF